MKDFISNEESGALFSDDRQHRYRLWRIWDKTKPIVMFVGLNPSTANEVDNDPTIRCVRNICKQWGYGGFYMMNLYSVIASNPKYLESTKDPVRDNDHHLEMVSRICKDVVFAWGNFKQSVGRSAVLETMFYNKAFCIMQHEKGYPVHPLWAGMWAPPSIKITFTEPRKFNHSKK